MKAKIIWDSDLTFTGTADTGFTVPLGGDPEVGGRDDGFRPMELIAVGLAGCTGMDVISILEKKRQEITGFEVQVDAQRAGDHPKIFTHTNVHYKVTGRDVDEEALKRSIELSETKYCPAQAMLREVAEIQHSYEILEAE